MLTSLCRWTLSGDALTAAELFQSLRRGIGLAADAADHLLAEIDRAGPVDLDRNAVEGALALGQSGGVELREVGGQFLRRSHELGARHRLVHQSPALGGAAVDSLGGENH